MAQAKDRLTTYVASLRAVNAGGKRALGIQDTARNWRTVERLITLVEDESGTRTAAR